MIPYLLISRHACIWYIMSQHDIRSLKRLQEVKKVNKMFLKCQKCKNMVLICSNPVSSGSLCSNKYWDFFFYGSCRLTVWFYIDLDFWHFYQSQFRQDIELIHPLFASFERQNDTFCAINVESWVESTIWVEKCQNIEINSKIRMP